MHHDAGLSDDWLVITAFYSALHWMAAAFEHQFSPARVPNSHAGTRELYGRPIYQIPEYIRLGYQRLYDLSWIARYSVDDGEWITDVDVNEAKDLLEKLRDWAMGKLPDELL